MLGGQEDVSAFVSTAPTEATPAWRASPGFLMGPGFYEVPATVSCASTSLCVVAFGESAMISTDPAASHPTWRAPAPIVELPTGAVSLRGSPTARGPRLVFHLGCVAEWIEECRGAATLTATEQLAANRRTIIGVGATAKRTRRRTVVIGRTTFATGFAGNGKDYTLEVRLNRAGSRLLARFKRLRATLSVTAAASELRVPPRTIAVQTVRVTFTTSRPKHRRTRSA